MKWQLIETAPADGSEVDLWVITTCNGQVIEAFRWPKCCWQDGEWQDDYSAVEEEYIESSNEYVVKATHWIRIEPPADGGAT